MNSFNQLGEHQKNFLLHKWRMMEEGNLYKRLLGDAIRQGASQEYYMGFMDQSGWWNRDAQEAWQKGYMGWRKDGAGASMMNIATVGIGVPLVAVGGGSIIGGMAMPAASGTTITISPVMTFGNGLRAYLGTKWCGAIQSGGLNFFTQWSGNNWDINKVDWTGVGSATVAGYAMGPGWGGLVKGSFIGALGDAAVDLTGQEGFKTVLMPWSNEYKKDMSTFGVDLSVGFFSNLAGGAGGINASKYFGPMTTSGAVLEGVSDMMFINANIQMNK